MSPLGQEQTLDEYRTLCAYPFAATTFVFAFKTKRMLCPLT